MSGETFAAMLRRLRESAGVSQNVLARAAKIDPAYVNRMERSGQRTVSGLQLNAVSPSRDVALALATALDLAPAMTDRFLYAAGLAPQEDWQARAVKAEVRLATIREALAEDDEQPTFIRRRVG